MNGGPRCQVDIASQLALLVAFLVAEWPDGQRHAVAKSFGEGGDPLRVAAGVKIGEDANAIAGRALVILRSLVRVVFDDPDTALVVHGDAGGRDDVGLLGDEIEY